MLRAFVLVSLAMMSVSLNTAFGQAEPKTPHVVVPIDLDDVVSFAKAAVEISAGLLVMFAGVGIAFFGFDVRKAKSSIDEQLTVLRGLVAEASKLKNEAEKSRLEQDKKEAEIKSLHARYLAAATEIESRLQQLGTAVEDLAQGAGSDDGDGPGDGGGPGTRRPHSDTVDQPSRTNAELIRDIIRSSRFEWTSKKRLMQKTGLDETELFSLIRAMPDIEIGFGKESRDTIFRIKRKQAI